MNVSSTCSLSTPSSASSFSSPANGRGIQIIPGILYCFGCKFDQHGEEQMGRCTGVSVACASAAPGIVARLMGLESLPMRQYTQTRSRSPKMSSISDYQEFEDDKYIILSFEQRPLRNKGRRRSGGIEKENEEMNRVYGRNLSRSKRNSGPVSYARNNPRNLQHSSPSRNLIRKPRKQRQKNLKYDGDDESENSSPNSVLNFASAEFSVSDKSKSQITVSDYLKNRRYALPEHRKPAGSGKKITAASTRKTNRDIYSAWKQTGEHRQISTRDTVESALFPHRRHTEEIGCEIASEIFGFLLDELLITFP